MEVDELLIERYELYKELEKGINSLESGKKYSSDEVYNELEKF